MLPSGFVQFLTKTQREKRIYANYSAQYIHASAEDGHLVGLDIAYGGLLNVAYNDCRRQ